MCFISVLVFVCDVRCLSALFVCVVLCGFLCICVVCCVMLLSCVCFVLLSVCLCVCVS